MPLGDESVMRLLDFLDFKVYDACYMPNLIEDAKDSPALSDIFNKCPDGSLVLFAITSFSSLLD